jgi:adenylate cyclase
MKAPSQGGTVDREPIDAPALGAAWAGLSRAQGVVAVVDAVESVRQMALDEMHFLSSWLELQRCIRDAILPAHHGQLVKSLGDGLLLRFDKPAAAVAAIWALLAEGARLGVALRAGAHLTELLVGELDIYGQGVNLAARLAGLARPGDLVISVELRDALTDGLEAHVTDLGGCYLKHFDEPVRAFRATPSPLSTSDQPAGLDNRPLATLAVLPFTALGADLRSKAFGSALADALNARLGRLPGLGLVSRLSTEPLRDFAQDIESCQRLLQADFLVTGHCLLKDERGNCAAQLLDARSGRLLWSQRAEIQLPALFTEADGGVARLAEAISSTLTSTVLQQARRLPLPHLDAFTLFLGGVAMLHRLALQDFQRAQQLLGTLHERHPRAAAPLAMLAKWHLLNVLQGWSADARAEGQAALAMAHHAIDLEPDHALALSIASLLGLHFGDDLAAARTLASRAAEIDPHEPSAWTSLAAADGYQAQGDQASEHALRAISLSPLDPCRFLFELMLAAGHLVAGRQGPALAALSNSLRLNAVHAPSHRLATIAHTLAGDADRARKHARQLMLLDPGFSVHRFVERYPGRHAAHARDYAAALRDAGIPP